MLYSAVQTTEFSTAKKSLIVYYPYMYVLNLITWNTFYNVFSDDLQ